MIDFGYGVSLGCIPNSRDTVDDLIEWRNDYRIWRWCRQNDLIEHDDHVKWFYKTRKKEKMYGVFSAEKLVGVAGLTNLSAVNQRAEFSLYIAPSYQDKGYGSRALKTLLDHGFSNLNMHVIWGEMFDGNPAKHLFEKIGLVCEGRRRDFYYREGRFIDALLYSMTKQEWEDRLWK